MERLRRINDHLEPSPAAGVAEEHFDYIVVGGGSSGSVLAARLSENPNVTVLLLEAGGEDDNMKVNTPGLYSLLQKSELDWQYQTVPQKHQHNRVQNWPRGKVLGGCSSINAMLYVRGDRENYDSWAREGCTGWSFDEVLPFFIKSENSKVDDVDPGYHGKDGPLVIERPVSLNEYTHRWVKAATEAGIPFNKDYNGRSMIGVSYSQTNITGGVRQNSSRAFLRQARTRPNLKVIPMAYVTQVLFQGAQAIGVKFRSGSASFATLAKGKTSSSSSVVFCRKEVLLCAGAVNTPWLLMISGVGPQQELQKHGIPIVKRLEGVGKNLQDHLYVFHPFVAKDSVSFSARKDLKLLLRVGQYLATGAGMIGTCLLQAVAFLRTGLDPQNKSADLQIHFVPSLTVRENSENANITDPFWLEPEKWGSHGFTAIPTLLQPKSVGEIRLASASPFDYPVIDPNYFSDPEGYDIKVMVEGMKLCRKIAAQQSLKPHLSGEAIDPGIKAQGEDEYLQEFIRKAAITVYHPVGTCKMGRESEGGVVGPDLRVHGISGLRVVDCSIMPKIVSANTNAPAMMIAEKAAHMILNEK